jgi:hypothetical protein
VTTPPQEIHADHPFPFAVMPDENRQGWKGFS